MNSFVARSSACPMFCICSLYTLLAALALSIVSGNTRTVLFCKSSILVASVNYVVIKG